MAVLRTKTRRVREVAVLCLLLLGILQLSGAALIQAKAWLAPHLIGSAWSQALQQSNKVVKPWPWADTWPVARLRVPEEGIDLPVLAGDTGNALAFGPGYALASSAPGSGGMTVIGGHRDTHFTFLRRLKPGHSVQLQLPTGEWLEYTVQSTAVVDTRQSSLSPNTIVDSLLLVTCYPFDALRVGGPLRYTVEAVRAG